MGSLAGADGARLSATLVLAEPQTLSGLGCNVRVFFAWPNGATWSFEGVGRLYQLQGAVLLFHKGPRLSDGDENGILTELWRIEHDAVIEETCHLASIGERGVGLELAIPSFDRLFAKRGRGPYPGVRVRGMLKGRANGEKG